MRIRKKTIYDLFDVKRIGVQKLKVRDKKEGVGNEPNEQKQPPHFAARRGKIRICRYQPRPDSQDDMENKRWQEKSAGQMFTEPGGDDISILFSGPAYGVPAEGQ